MLVCLIGFFAGIIGGMGMGGGTILIPALVLFANIDPKLAQSINLLSWPSWTPCSSAAAVQRR